MGGNRWQDPFHLSNTKKTFCWFLTAVRTSRISSIFSDPGMVTVFFCQTLNLFFYTLGLFNLANNC